MARPMNSGMATRMPMTVRTRTTPTIIAAMVIARPYTNVVPGSERTLSVVRRA